jgi:hypothetical protein
VRRSLAAALSLALAVAAGCRRDDPPAPPPPAADAYPGDPIASAHPDPAGAATWGKVQYVALAADEPGTIHYTLDGTVPVPGAAGTRSGRNPVFWIRAGPGTTTVTFFAVDDAGNRGPTATAVYEVTPP